MIGQGQSYQINKSYDDVVADLKQAISNRHPLPIVKVEEIDGETATFSVVRRYANMRQLPLIDARGTLHRKANDMTYLDIKVDVLTMTAILLTGVEVAITLFVFTILTRSIGEVVGYIGLAIIVAILTLRHVRYSLGFRKQMNAFFGAKWWEKTL
jgi:hypothetical protein